MNLSMRLFSPAAPLVLLATLATSPAHGAVRPSAARADVPPAAVAAAGHAAGYQVTLLTGDKVTVGYPGGTHPGIIFTPGRGRAGVPFHISTGPAPGGHTDISVVPADAGGLVGQGRLDPRLFDVSLLARDGYPTACAAAMRWERAGASAGSGITAPAAWPPCPTAHGLPAAPAPAPGQPRAGTPSYLVRVRVLDRAGQPLPPPSSPAARPPYSVLGTVVNTATGAATTRAGYDRKAGIYTMRLPAGHYYLDGLVDTGAYRAGMAEPDVPVRGNTTITLDARTAVPDRASVGRPGAKPLLELNEIDQTVAGKGVSSAYGVLNSPGDIEPFYFTPTSPVHGRPFLSSLHISLTTPGAFPTSPHFVPASYEYNLVFTHEGSVPASLGYRVASGQLATAPTRYYTQRPRLPSADTVQQANVPIGPADTPGNELYLSLDSPAVVAAGGQATMYYNSAPNVRWFREYLIDDVSDDPTDIAPPETLTPGHVYPASFDAAALAPAGMASRQGNTLYAVPAPFSPAEPGHYLSALSPYSQDGSSVETTLALNGKVIGRSALPYPAYFHMPSGRGRYTLTEVAARPASTWSVLGTRSTAVWSFFSAHRASLGALPLLTVRTAGPFSSSGALPAGKAVPLSLTVQELPPGARLTDLTVSASSDGGHTWHPLRIYRAGKRWLAVLTTPSAGGYVSLRTSASDSAGDTAAITTIRAFALTAG